ncbi:hypothetical protein NBRC10513v2_002168 [Rhodotorula toruloides]|uniref:BY PROTMAP: gi/472588557/gb/EMS26029.1/ zinc finger, C2H2-type domain containing protein [Rhodosporidium toruloides NP11] gi/647396346/emb/CDR38444.1/ RHTO0S03e09582g1_1 [Rhodosporidium toruloides] n=1 Tax=Rhodotorula toruloides TaxID=5286 RepID=A0A0K3C7Z4_RHOTO
MLGTDEHKPVLASPSASFAFDIQPKQLMPQQQQSDGGLLTTEPLHGMPAQRVEAAGASSTSYEPWQQQQSHAHSAGGAAGRWYEGHAAQNGGPHSTEHTQQQQPYAPYTPTQHLPTAVPYPTSQPSALAAYTGWQNHGQHAPYQPYHLPPIDAPSSQPNGAQYEQPALSTYAQQPYPRNDSYAPYAQQHSYSGSHSATPSDTPPAHLSSNDAYRPPPFNLSLPSIAQSLPPAYGMGSYGQAPIDHSNPAMARYGPPQPHAATTDANAIPGPSTALSLSHQRSITPLAPSAPHLNAADAPNGVDDGFGGSSARQGQGQSSSTRKRKEPKDAATRKYQCTECDQKFARPSALATHILTHTKEKPFTCVTCNRGFAVMSNLRRHCRVRNHALAPSQESSHAKRTDSNNGAGGQHQRRSNDSPATHSNGLQSAPPAVPHHLVDGHAGAHLGMSPPLQTATSSLSLPPLPYT